MTNDTDPPVGATVTDTRGYVWRMADDALWHWVVGNGVQIAQGVQHRDHESALTLAWHLQQERDQLQAENAALREVIRGAANAGVQVDEPRLTWVELQMERDDWQALVAAAQEGRDAAIDAARGDA